MRKVVFIVAIILTLTGCRTTGSVTGTIFDLQAELIESHQRIRELEDRDRAYQRIVDDTKSRLEGIGERAGRLVGSARDLLRLFDEYQSAVAEYFAEIERERNAAANGEPNSSDAGDSPGDTDTR